MKTLIITYDPQIIQIPIAISFQILLGSEVSSVLSKSILINESRENLANTRTIAIKAMNEIV